jgi:hypothetical protein
MYLLYHAVQHTDTEPAAVTAPQQMADKGRQAGFISASHITLQYAGGILLLNYLKPERFMSCHTLLQSSLANIRPYPCRQLFYIHFLSLFSSQRHNPSYGNPC